MNTSDCMFSVLPDSLMNEILVYFNLRERRLLLSCNKYFWRLRLDIERNLGRLKILQEDAQLLIHSSHYLSTHSVWLYWSGFSNLIHLDLTFFATDVFLKLISLSNTPQERNGHQEELLENLQHINLRYSKGVTDEGLLALSQGSMRAENLKSVDITFCKNTTYHGTFPLRDNLKNLQLIRRQPEWMDGTYLTPFDNQSDARNSAVEYHIYWADGTFSFNRSTQSSGFICELTDWNNENKNDPHFLQSENCGIFVGDKLQYNNFVPPEGWPSWTRYCYRPGVSILKLPDEIAHDSQNNTNRVKSVLVAQRLSGMKAPKDSPLLSQTNSIPLGQYRQFRQDGTLIDTSQQQLPQAPVLDENGEGPYVMISRMQVEPLPEKYPLMPPDDLVLRNKQFCETMKTSSERERRFLLTPGIIDGEDIIHTALLWRGPQQET